MTKPRKSLQEMAAAGEKGPWACRRCGCKRTRVVKTWVLEGGAVRRKRVCEHCGQDFTHTTEVPCPTGFKVVVDDGAEPEAERACA